MIMQNCMIQRHQSLKKMSSLKMNMMNIYYVGRAEERASNVRGLWARDGGGITRFPPHVTTWEGKGDKVDMDGCSHGEGRAKDISDGISERRSKYMPS